MKRREFIPALGLGSSILIASARGSVAALPGESPQPVNSGGWKPTKAQLSELELPQPCTRRSS